jgi:hypothetical protein
MSHDDEIDKELRFHVDSRIDDLVASGVPLDRARRQARLEFGGVMQTKEAVRDLRPWSIANGLLQDCRLAFRTLCATPVVTFVAVLSLALGIGANTAMFSLVNSLMLRALPVRDPARLVLLESREPEGYPEWSYPFWSEIRQRPQLFEASAAWSPTARANFTVAGVTTKADGFLASGSFFDTLGVTALVGRTFSEADDQRGGGPDGPVAVISHGDRPHRDPRERAVHDRRRHAAGVLRRRRRPHLRRDRAAQHRTDGEPHREPARASRHSVLEHRRAAEAGPDPRRRD